ncbi:polysaccharide deacetylase family protein [Lederbergia citrea]|uniref:polysaccharide deacetylase family protein n=1 Tax=Lederbergia citrea TaxID=2833581 RepID=UPI001BC949FB|nr:polysaccharide deacetylase family protein [Lederbergia citrea]MBS4179072.1 polysaccharide deacetylase family protein [Lederbergia citrea]
MLKVIKLLLMFSLLMIMTACVSQKSLPIEKLPSKKNDLHPKDKEPISFILDRMMEKAREGMIIDSSFNVMDSSFQQVKTKWGKPDQIDQVAGGSYATYYEKNVVLGFNADGEIYDLRSSKELKDITSKTVEQYLGPPDEIREYNNERIYVYGLKQNIELKMIIPNATKFVDHISVYNPQRAIAEEYTLDIKGKSNQLSNQAWNSMQNWRKQISLFSKEHGNVYLNGPNKKMVALTFDDGPDDTITPAIIDILDDYNVKGNFFFLGSKVKLNPQVVKNAYNKGNLILSHSYNHLELTKLSKEDIQTEIESTEKAIQSVIGKKTAILRTPYGDTDEKVVTVTQKQGYSIVLWSIDTLDWSQKEAGHIVNNVVENVRNGDIILMHSDSDKIETAKALPLIIESLQKMNYEIVDLETLLNVKAYQ